MFNQKIKEQIDSLISEIPIIVGVKNLRHDIDELVKLSVPAKTFAVIDDKNTDEVLGNRVFSALKGKYACRHITLDKFVIADDKNANYIKKNSANCDVLIAVGSGTINDLCKYVSFTENKPYIVFPTAASMNGYLSANASISIGGHKTTLPAHLPHAVFCDFEVIAAAPSRLNKSGLGDSLARPTAQADWLLSHLLLNTQYNEQVFSLLREFEEQVFSEAKGISSGDMETLVSLLKLLLLSGLGMTIAKGSYPASQAEHMIAHSYYMLKHDDNVKYSAKLPPLHGEEIGITSLYMAGRQEKLLNSKIRMADRIFDNDHMRQLFTLQLSEEFLKEYKKKTNLIESIIEDDYINKNIWQNIVEKIEKITLPPQYIENILKSAKCYTKPEEIGWNDNLYKTARKAARFTRNRFTFLDIEEA